MLALLHNLAWQGRLDLGIGRLAQPLLEKADVVTLGLPEALQDVDENVVRGWFTFLSFCAAEYHDLLLSAVSVRTIGKSQSKKKLCRTETESSVFKSSQFRSAGTLERCP